MGESLRRWGEQLSGWGVPEDILARAPESPWTFDVALFARIADEADRAQGPSTARAREVLPDGGSVLDVGCGAGAGCLPLVPPAGHLIGVDPSTEMLSAFAERAEAVGATHEEVVGSWPEVAGHVPAADVVVSHHVLYGVAELGPFVTALAEHARRRVVVEITEGHPLAWMAPYWREVHGLERPHGPTSDDAAAAIGELGIDVRVEHSERPSRSGRDLEEVVPFLRRRLCLPAQRDAELAVLVGRFGRPEVRRVATLWWDA
jgi:SAM-dependent methyltransferase